MARQTLPTGDAIKTYRYLRLGMIGAVLMLGFSILIEHHEVVEQTLRDCWQTSISAYYYTPVRAVFVGMLFVVGFALIVIKGIDWEDDCLNIAGLLAPVVAIMPTTDVVRDPAGKPGCWSHAPDAFPTVTTKVEDTKVTELASWVVANVNNNFKAYLITAFVSLLTAGVVTHLAHKGIGSVKEPLTRSKKIGFAISFLILIGATMLFGVWREFFHNHAHGKAAIGLFVFLFLAVAINWRRNALRTWRRRAYGVIAAAMAGGAVVIGLPGLVGLPRPFGEHTVFALEFWEMAMFAVYWLIQTIDNWNEKVPAG